MNYFIYFILFIECDSWKDFVAGECARYASKIYGSVDVIRHYV